jgi:hypothetical protein
MSFPNFLKINEIYVKMSTLQTAKNSFSKNVEEKLLSQKRVVFGGFFQEFTFISFF